MNTFTGAPTTGDLYAQLERGPPASVPLPIVDQSEQVHAGYN